MLMKIFSRGCSSWSTYSLSTSSILTLRGMLKLTGRDNDLILANSRLASGVLQARGRALFIRQVLVPGLRMVKYRRLGDFSAFFALRDSGGITRIPIILAYKV